jgi:shikimate dehydrogenase
MGHSYELRDCPGEEAVRAVFAELRRGEIAGANITVPYKRLALELADGAVAMASDVGAANVWVRDEAGGVVAHNTDVAALVADLSEVVGRSVSAAACVIGNGGAALAATVACRRLGASPVYVTARRFHAGAGAWSDGEAFERLGASLLAWPEADGARDGFETAVSECRLVVQATSAGMLGADSGEAVATLVPWAALGSGSVAYDLVYNPPVTPFLRAAERAGFVARGGLGMLVGQAVEAFRLWLGVVPPKDRMLAAAEHALFGGA